MIYTNYIHRVACSGVCHIGISDHSLIYVYRKLSLAAFSKGHSTISFRNFQNFNRESFRSDIAQQDWSCNGSEDPNVLWTNWKTKFLDIVNIHATLRTRRARTNKAAWINSKLKKGMHDRDAAKRKAITSHDPRDWDKYKKLRNKINNNIKTSKASYYSNAFIQSKRVILEKRGKPLMSLEIKLNDAVISNSSELSNAFNDHFSTVEPRLANVIPPIANNNSSYTNNINVNNNKFSFSSINCSIVFLHLIKLSRSKATGLDNISPKIIRECADLISVSLCDLFNKSLVSGIFPGDWKCARVAPLFKQGKSSDLNSYRPISVISVIAKVFERIIHDQLYNFLTNEDIISNHQSGFFSLHSTVTALLEATDDWAFNTDRGNFKVPLRRKSHLFY